MPGRSLLSLLSMAMLAYRPSEASSPPEPQPQVAEPDLGEPDTEPPPGSDPLDGLRSERPADTSKRPDPIEVMVDAVIAEEDRDAPMIEVGADARFPVYMTIESVEPETPLLAPGLYAVFLHSPSKTFRGPTPKKGKRVRFHMTIVPEDPEDPHDEVFFADLWID